MTEQLDLFEVTGQQEQVQAAKPVAIFEEGNRVRVKNAKELDSPCVETVSYLTDYRFGGKVGTIKRVQVGTESVSYEVLTNVGAAIVTEEEVAFIS
ncbi:hypothetical protein [Bacillus safensis]|uniref:Uncharacterized protein n=1 Tax=Bacillus safensis TaxID=561879 RepID=A0A1L6ZJC0_BACIA|nr:hypothetical protein [Bacillus safensis]APT46609.1 hypothetical protein BSA145_12590 [Bacillus safensis]